MNKTKMDLNLNLKEIDDILGEMDKDELVWGECENGCIIYNEDEVGHQNEDITICVECVENPPTDNWEHCSWEI